MIPFIEFVDRPSASPPTQSFRLLQLLLGSEIVGVSTLPLSTVGCLGMESCITFTTNHLVTVVFLCQNPEGWLNDSTSQPKDQM